MVHLLWGGKSFWKEGVFVTELKTDSWPMRTWYKPWGGTCFGYGVMLAPGMSSSVLKHELIHTEQLEAGASAGLILGIICSIVTLNVLPVLICWLFMGVFSYLGASLIAFLKGKEAYKGNHLEEAARAGAKEPPL